MSGEALQVALGAVALVSTVETCYRGYKKLIASTYEAPAMSSDFSLDLQIEKHRFELYWQYMDKTSVGFELFDEQSPRTQGLIQDTTNRIRDLLKAADVVAVPTRKDDEQGIHLVPLAQEVDTEAAITPNISPEPSILRELELLKLKRSQSTATGPLLPRSASAPTTVPILQRVRWAWWDGGRAQKLVADLKKYNDVLWTALSPAHARLLKLAAPSFILPGISDETILKMLYTSHGNDDLDKALVQCSRLRKQRMHTLIQNDETRSLVQRHTISPESVILSDPTTASHGLGPRRAMGMLNGASVVIEYKQIRPPDHRERDVVRNRLYELAALLSEEYSPTLRTLLCLGVWCPDPGNDRYYGLVFQVPMVPKPQPVTFVTLADLVAERDERQPPLGDRFKLALALSIAVMHLHAAAWLHEHFRPENIVFAKVGGGAPDITEPRILGFDTSRPSAPTALSLETPGAALFEAPIDLYTHPARQSQQPQRFHLRHDYFALGMCLLEIALWQPLSLLKARLERPTSILPADPLIVAQRNQGSGGMTAAEWAARVQDCVLNEVGGRYGEIYRDVVLVCLSGDFTAGSQVDYPAEPGGSEDRAFQTAFFHRVVKRLATCKA